MNGFTTTLLTGLAQRLDADPDVDVVWRPTGVYQAGEAGVFIRAVPPSPDRVVVLSAYAVTDNAGLANDITGVQVRCRGTRDPRVADDLADAIFDALHGAEHLTLGGIAVPKVWRNSHAPIGVDANGRHETSSNYYLHVTRPSAHRVD